MQSTRECKQCGEPKPLTDFPVVATKVVAGKRKRYRARSCDDCRKAAKRAQHKATMEDPIAAERKRRQVREACRRYRKADRERYLAQAEKARAKRAADPERHARDLEDRRIQYRAKREALGLPVRDPARLSKDRQRRAATRVEEVPVRVPVGPLVALVEKVKAEREEIAAVIDDPSYGRLASIMRELDLSERLYRYWRSGDVPDTSLGQAEAILMALDVEPAAVFSPDDHADVLAQMTTVEVVA